MNKRNILILSLISLSCPAVCFAHSGNLLRAAMNFMPFLAPMLAAGIAVLRKYFRGHE